MHVGRTPWFLQRALSARCSIPFALDQLEDPYPLYARSRREEPVFHSPRFDVWVVGNILARLEGRIAFELVLERLPNVRRDVTHPAERRPYLILRGYEHLPVVWDIHRAIPEAR